MVTNPKGIKQIVDQQFEYGRQILAAGFVPILEPEVDIKSPDKAESEKLLKEMILDGLKTLKDNEQIMLKLSIPTEDNFYADLIAHPRIMRVVALSGGYSRDEANERLARNHKLIASFSRALAEGLSAKQTDTEFNSELSDSVEKIYRASVA